MTPLVIPKRTLEYVSPEGLSPFRDWLLALKDTRARGKILSRLAIVRAGSLGDCKSLADGLYELRVDFGPGYRIYFGQDGPALVVLLSGGDKASQAKDIKSARALWATYKGERHEPRS